MTITAPTEVDTVPAPLDARGLPLRAGQRAAAFGDEGLAFIGEIERIEQGYVLLHRLVKLVDSEYRSFPLARVVGL